MAINKEAVERGIPTIRDISVLDIGPGIINRATQKGELSIPDRGPGKHSVRRALEKVLFPGKPVFLSLGDRRQQNQALKEK